MKATLISLFSLSLPFANVTAWANTEASKSLTQPSTQASTQTSTQSKPTTSKKTIVILGDSITDGYGLEKELAYPNLLEKSLNDKGFKIQIVNAGVSGSTSASAPGRLKWLIQQKPEVVFLALGANDGLRGVPPSETKKNLKTAIELARKSGAIVWLAGMKMPPNYGAKFTREFEKVFIELSKELKVPFYPFLLDGVAGNESLNQSDKIHPNEKGHQILSRNIGKFFIDNLKEIK